ncbi:MAG: hypothetical protein IIC03_04445 [Proteobacteria bacterium]|nr:hypothetical protein [Pseudomonadota bacterium]
MTGIIEISLTPANFLTRWPCHVCGGRTEKDPVLAEGEQNLPSDGLPGRKYRTVRVCDQCLKGADGLSIDQRLETYARQLEYEAELTRAMIGKLQVPSHAEWEDACRAHDEAFELEYADATA